LSEQIEVFTGLLLDRVVLAVLVPRPKRGAERDDSDDAVDDARDRGRVDTRDAEVVVRL
jgi:hypothetical protein